MKLFGQRRQLLIDKLQVQLLSINLFYALLTLLVFVTIVFWPAVAALLDNSLSHEAKLRAADRMLLLHETVWPAVFVVLLLFTWHSLVYTHRIAGPLYRFRRVMVTIGRGDLRIRAGVRKKDYLRADSEAINLMIDGVSSRLTEIREAFRQLRAARVGLARCGNTVDLAKAAEALDAQMRGLELAIDRFQLPESDAHAVVSTKPERELVHF